VEAFMLVDAFASRGLTDSCVREEVALSMPRGGIQIDRQFVHAFFYEELMTTSLRTKSGKQTGSRSYVRFEGSHLFTGLLSVSGTIKAGKTHHRSYWAQKSTVIPKRRIKTPLALHCRGGSILPSNQAKSLLGPFPLQGEPTLGLRRLLREGPKRKAEATALVL
jgi:hypothetical protein